MKHEYSAGVIIYRIKAGEREYLLLNSREGNWGFAKGKLEVGEGKRAAAERELFEETGLRVSFDPAFEKSVCYIFRRSGYSVYKTVYYFIGQVVADAQIILSHEHSSFLWLSYKESLLQLTYENNRQMIHAAELFLAAKE